MKIYVAGPLCNENERRYVEKIAKLCEKEGFKTFLPHRDVGLYKDKKDVKEIARKDIEEIKNCEIMIGVLNGICVGAGTAFEMGFAESLGKKVIGLKTDRGVDESIGDISAVIAGRIEIVESIEELKERLHGIKLA